MQDAGLRAVLEHCSPPKRSPRRRKHPARVNKANYTADNFFVTLQAKHEQDARDSGEQDEK